MSHRYRLYPSPEQVPTLVRHCSDARFVWNLALEQANLYRPDRGPTPNHAERCRQLSEARRETWLKEGSSSVQQGALRDFDQAMRNWWNGTHGRPTWRKAGHQEGFVVRDLVVSKLNAEWSSVVIPKLGPVKFKVSRALPEGAKSARVSLDGAGRWHVSITSTPVAREHTPTGAVVGIDRGVATTLATSDGQMMRIPTSSKMHARVKYLQRTLARQKRGSKRRAKTRQKIRTTNARITDRRKDWVEKQTTRLVDNYDAVVVENLKVKNMVARPKPKSDPASPGEYLSNGASAKAGLNRSIHASCWSMFERRLVDKARQTGVQVLLVDPAFTSQQCSACGHTDRENRESQAVFLCRSCGYSAHADYNAARNIVARGLDLAPTPGQGARRGRKTQSARVSPDPSGRENSSAEVAA